MRSAKHAPHFDAILSDRSVRDLAEALAAGRAATAVGGAGSSSVLVSGAVAAISKRPVLLIVAHLDDADEAVDELQQAGIDAWRFPALEVLPGETGVSLELFAERLAVQRRVVSGSLWSDRPGVLVCPIQAAMQGVPAVAKLDELSITLRTGDQRGHGGIVRWLENAGYSRVDSIQEPGDFAVRGGILDIFPPGGAERASAARPAPDTGDAFDPSDPKSALSSDAAEPGIPVRLDFWGDELESISEIDLDTMASDRKVRSVELVGASLKQLTEGDAASVNLLDLIPTTALALVTEPMEVIEQGRGYYERVTDSRGVWGPPAVVKTLRERFHAFATLSQFTVSGSAAKLSDGSRTDIALPARILREFARDAADAVKELGQMAADHRIIVLCQNQAERQRLGELVEQFITPDSPQHALRIESVVAHLHRGFVWGDDARPVALVPYHELLHRYQTRRRVRRLRGRSDRAADAFIDLDVGDYVVHADHGIAKFTGLKSMKPRGVKPSAEKEAEDRFTHIEGLKLTKGKGGKLRVEPRAGEGPVKAEAAEEEYLTLEFAGNTKLHVPASQIDRVQKYIGGHHGKPPLSVLGGKKWQHQKDQVKEAVRDLAKELLRVQAARETQPGIRYPEDTAWQNEFESEFPYQETDDQLAALGEIKKDMTRARPMDRLLCGDVGYGKTELAIRAAFKAVEYGKQVAVLVPTTILAEQHERTFKSRFADYPFRVESISRFKTVKESNDILAAARKGQVDILIGTHRLLSKDVRFADLGLVIVDEEQRFGVEHKNALLGLRMTADVLTLSATPIPRTLHMSMLGLRDISSLSTAPMDRRAVVTEVCPYNEKRIKQAIDRELAREGQVFFVHNRVHNIKSVADDLQKLVPDARIIIGHGQMPDDELEKVMSAFINRKADILVATTIIESGIDIPTANTMIINNADHFGLAELHQLRGRVGRYKHRAYCYLLLPADRPPTDIAARRLRAIEEFSMLGAGFKIAMRDLEIRGAGNLLGAEQSGHIAAVGYDMYCQLLEQTTHELRSEKVVHPSDTTIEIGVTGALPKLFIPSDSRRIEAYRRLASSRSFADLTACIKALLDAYGKAPKQAERLFDLAAVRIGAQLAGVRSITVHGQDIVFRCEDSAPVCAALQGVQGTVRPIAPRQITPIGRGVPKLGTPIRDPGLGQVSTGGAMHEVYFRPPPSYLEPDSLLLVLRRRLAAAFTMPEVEARPAKPQTGRRPTISAP